MARTRRKHRKKYRSKRRATFAHNPVRRRRHRSYRRKARARHHYRSNPPAIRGVLNDTLWAGVGYVGTKFAVGAVLPAINVAATPPSMTSIAAKFGVAYAVAWGGEKFLGSGKFTPIFIGGVVSALQDFVTLYLAPSIPALAGPYNMGAYYRPPMTRALPAPRSMGAYVGTELSAEDIL